MMKKVRMISAAIMLAVGIGAVGVGFSSTAHAAEHAGHQHAAVTQSQSAASANQAEYGIMCWLFGHNWRRIHSYKDRNGVTQSIYACSRCGSSKIITGFALKP